MWRRVKSDQVAKHLGPGLLHKITRYKYSTCIRMMAAQEHNKAGCAANGICKVYGIAN